MSCSSLRQLREGMILIGSTQEDVGLDTSTSIDATIQLSRRALRLLPDLAGVTLVRQWAGLRIMSEDGCLVYVESEDCPGAFLVICHSGVTLAPVHAGALGQAISENAVNRDFAPFHPRRFACSRS